MVLSDPGETCGSEDIFLIVTRMGVKDATGIEEVEARGADNILQGTDRAAPHNNHPDQKVNDAQQSGKHFHDTGLPSMSLPHHCNSLLMICVPDYPGNHLS